MLWEDFESMEVKEDLEVGMRDTLGLVDILHAFVNMRLEEYGTWDSRHEILEGSGTSAKLKTRSAFICSF